MGLDPPNKTDRVSMAPGSYLVAVVGLRRLFTHVVAGIGDALKLPLADVLVPVHVLLYHFLQAQRRNNGSAKPLVHTEDAT